MESLYDDVLNENGSIDPNKVKITETTKIDTLYDDIDPKLLPTELKELYDDIPTSNERARRGIRMTYLATIMEARAVEALFWIVPDKHDWRVIFFEEEYFKCNSHATLWRNAAADIVANSFKKTATDDFKKLWMAYPRGRVLNVGPQKWAIGFGGDLPSGWTKEKLASQLNVVTDDVRAKNHWLSDKNQRIEADAFLNIRH